MARLDGRVVLISGTGRGQGRAAALAFSAAGARVFGCDVLADEAEETLALVRDRGGEMGSLHPLDVSDFEQAKQWARAAYDRWRRIDVLYNNAASLRSRGSFAESTMEDWALTLRYELTIVYASTLAVWPYFVEQNSGVVISTASMSGHVETHPLRSSAHGATKAGVMAFARMLAAEGAPHNIRSVSISPGLIETPTVARFFSGDDARQRALGAALVNKIPRGPAGSTGGHRQGCGLSCLGRRRLHQRYRCPRRWRLRRRILPPRRGPLEPREARFLSWSRRADLNC